jgi:hypothetical protein
MEEKDKPKSIQEERFSEDSILEIVVTVFVVVVVSFLFFKIVFL